MTARRLGRKIRTAEEPLLQWRRQGLSEPDEETGRQERIGEHIINIYEGIVTPLSFQRGRDTATGNITFLTNPTFILINPSDDMDGYPIDIAQGDLFVRLKYHESPYKTQEDGTKEKHDYQTPFNNLSDERQDELKHIAFNAVHHILEVHSFETQFNGMRLLGELQA